MANYFELIERLQNSIDALDAILLGDENATVNIQGQVRDSIAKDLKDNFAALQAMVQGRLAYQTKAAMNAAGAPPAGQLAEVWSDSTLANNGIYGWTGAQWQKSEYDPVAVLNAQIDTMGEEFSSIVAEQGIEVDSGELVDSDGRGVAFAITDVVGASPFSVLSDGSVVLGHVSFSSLSINGIAYAIADDNGFAPFAVTEIGEVLISGVGHYNFIGGWDAFSLADESGKAALRINIDGEVDVPRLSKNTLKKLRAPLVSRNIDADYQQVFCYGQSLSQGYRSLPALSISQPYQNKMFIGGVRSRADTGTNLSSLVPLVESVDGLLGETPLSATVNYFSELLERENELSSNRYFQRWVGSAPGYGGVSIWELEKDAQYWSGITDQISELHDIAQAEGKSHSVNLMVWAQGEGDYEDGTLDYKDRVIQLKNDFCAHAVGVTGQKHNPIFISYQLASHRRYTTGDPFIALDLLQASREDQDFYLTCPMYAMEYYSDVVHLTNEGSRMLGHFFGLVAKKVLFDGDDYRPLQPIDVLIQSRVIELKLHVPEPPLVFDTNWVSFAENFGFDVWASNGTLLDIISDVEISGWDRVRITLSSNLPAGAYLTYAKGRDGDAPGANKNTGPRGNLRDSQGDIYWYWGADGVKRELHNWCVIFKEVLL